MTEIKQRDDGITVVHDGHEFTFSHAELRCPGCGSGQIKLTYVEEHEEGSVRALALGTECKSCGDDALHVSY